MFEKLRIMLTGRFLSLLKPVVNKKITSAGRIIDVSCTADGYSAVVSLNGRPGPIMISLRDFIMNEKCTRICLRGLHSSDPSVQYMLDSRVEGRMLVIPEQMQGVARSIGKRMAHCTIQSC